jgi:hypothetical protein
MDYLLSGLGTRLSRPVVRRLQDATLNGALSDALDMLRQHPACECIEVFAGRLFLVEVGPDGAGAHLFEAGGEPAFASP